MNDMLVRMLAKQSELNATITPDITFEGAANLPWDVKLNWARKLCQAIFVETSELLLEVGYKWWKKPKEDSDEQMEKIKLECIDILHFLLCLFILFGVSAEEVHEIYFKKNEKNKTRPDWDNRLSSSQAVLPDAGSNEPAEAGAPPGSKL